MGTIIKKKNDFLTRFPIGLLVIIFIGFSPLIIGAVGSWMTEFFTGEACHEGNCGWMVLPWLTIITLPIGGVLLIIYLVIFLIDLFQFFKNKKTYNNLDVSEKSND